MLIDNGFVKLELMNNAENIVFFDIDGTLTSSTDHFILKHQKSTKELTHKLYKNWKTIGLYDYSELTHSCIALFSLFLRQTNSKAICISSWNNNENPELYIKELTEAFEGISDFPQDWLLGFIGGSGGDRFSTDINPFIKNLNIKKPYVILDDGGFTYSKKENVVIVDGRLGFNIYDYEKALNILKIKEEPDLGYFERNIK